MEQTGTRGAQGGWKAFAKHKKGQDGTCPFNGCPGGNPGTRVSAAPAPCGAVLTMNKFILGALAARYHTVKIVFSSPPPRNTIELAAIQYGQSAGRAEPAR